MRRAIVPLLVLLVCVFAAPARGDVVMNVVASPAPNFFNSPSWTGYLANALNSLENNLGPIGDRMIDPTAYEIFPTGAEVDSRELVLSTFNSWRGVADPADPFANETGNRIHFGVHIVGDGLMRFRLEDLAWEISDTGAGTLNASGNFAGGSYSAARIGIDYGMDMMKGGGDDVVITSGAANQVIDELIYVGVGSAFDASSFPGPSNQERIDQLLGAVGNFVEFDITGGYTLTDELGTSILASGSTTISVVPEPGGFLALCLITGGVVLRRRRG